jgi:hypothetical protein
VRGDEGGRRVVREDPTRERGHQHVRLELRQRLDRDVELVEPRERGAHALGLLRRVLAGTKFQREPRGCRCAVQADVGGRDDRGAGR